MNVISTLHQSFPSQILFRSKWNAITLENERKKEWGPWQAGSFIYICCNIRPQTRHQLYIYILAYWILINSTITRTASCTCGVEWSSITLSLFLTLFTWISFSCLISIGLWILRGSSYNLVVAINCHITAIWPLLSSTYAQIIKICLLSNFKIFFKINITNLAIFFFLFGRLSYFFTKLKLGNIWEFSFSWKFYLRIDINLII